MTKQEKYRKTLVLLDTHAILHRAYHALPEFTSQKGEPTGALYGLSSMLLRLMSDLKPDYVVACYDLPEPTFRHKEYKEYKAGRAKTDDALIAQIIRSRDVLTAFSIPFYEQPGFEADDLLGTITEQLKNNDDIRIVIASGDMDTLQLVRGEQVVVYTLKKGINDTVLYNEKAVIDRFGFKPSLLSDYKGLSGDQSDNIPGIVGIGEKSASALLSTFGALETIYEELQKDQKKFTDAGIRPRVIKLLQEGEDEAFFSKMLATIRTDAPIKFTLPKKTWRESVSPDQIIAMFTEFDFRSLSARAKVLLSVKENENIVEEEQAQPEDLAKTGVALWLLDSSKTNPSQADILVYAKKELFSEAKKYIFEELEKQGLTKLYTEIELPLFPILRRAEEWGIAIDIEYLKNLSREYRNTLEQQEKKIYKLAGEEFNINSPKQLGGILFDKLNLSVKGLKKTAGGARSTRESELVKLRGVHKIIDSILIQRELQKLLTTYIDPLPKLADTENRLHTSFSQTGTTTGRVSSSNPNLQNIPVQEGYGKEIRKAFIAPKEQRLVSFDYSQIEMRMLAHLSQDENLLDVFRSKKDAHTAVAARVFDLKEDTVTKDMRRHAKTINFGIMYGMGVNALKVSLGGTRAEAEEFYNRYFEKYPKVKEYFEKVKQEAYVRGYTETIFGRRRYFPELHSHIPYIKATAERMAMNAPLQGSAADIVKIATIRVDETLCEHNKEQDIHLLLQVHDELVFEIPKDDITEAVHLIQNAMENTTTISVPLTVNIEVGKNWGEMKTYVSE